MAGTKPARAQKGTERSLGLSTIRANPCSTAYAVAASSNCRPIPELRAASATKTFAM